MELVGGEGQGFRLEIKPYCKPLTHLLLARARACGKHSDLSRESWPCQEV
jgi:hypothetical protein